MSEQIQGPTPQEVLAEGGNFTVKNRSFEDVQVFLRMLPMDLYPEYARVMEDEQKAVELFADKPGLCKTLPPSSIGKLMEEGERMNADFFPWFDRRVKRMERIAPGSSGLRQFNSMTTSQASA